MKDYDEINDYESRINELQDDKIGWIIVSVVLGVMLVIVFGVGVGGGV